MEQDDKNKAKAPQREKREIQVWKAEKLTPYDYYKHGLVEILESSKTKYQNMIIGDKGTFGRALFLDGRLQTAEGDEEFYHEPLVHVPCLLHESPKNVLVLGGADGGAAKQLLRWRTVSRVVVVDIDGEVVKACRKWLPQIHGNCWEDTRTELIVGDALDYIEDCKDKFDVVLVDLTDPDYGSPSFQLFTKEFFSKVKKCMSEDATMATLGGSSSLVEDAHLLPRVHNTLKAVFGHVATYRTYVGTYGTPLAFCVASSKDMKIYRDYREFDEIIKRNVRGELQVIDGRALQGSFGLPPCLRRAIAREEVVFSMESDMLKVTSHVG